jgi:hypothetical protein
VRARAQIVRQALGGGAQVRAGRQPNEPDHHSVLVKNTNLDAAVRDRDGNFLAWDGAHRILL